MLIVVIAIIVAAFSGYVLALAFCQNSGSGQSPQTSVMISKIIAVKTWINGGAGFCEGYNSSTTTATCVGNAIVEYTSTNMTSYSVSTASPNETSQSYYATITTLTTTESVNCSNAYTTFTTISSTSSGAYRIDWSWTQSCT